MSSQIQERYGPNLDNKNLPYFIYVHRSKSGMVRISITKTFLYISSQIKERYGPNLDNKNLYICLHRSKSGMVRIWITKTFLILYMFTDQRAVWSESGQPSVRTFHRCSCGRRRLSPPVCERGGPGGGSEGHPQPLLRPHRRLRTV